MLILYTEAKCRASS